MRELLSSSDPISTEFCRTLLEKAGIACSINDSENRWGIGRQSVSLQILHDGDFAEAQRILDSNHAEIHHYRPDWVCFTCAETNSGKIEVCPICNHLRPGICQTSIYQVFEMIRPKPGLYLGENSIRRLDSYLHGLIFGLGLEGMALRDSHRFWLFQDWLVERLGISNSTSGWCSMILSKSANEEEALRLFYTLLDEFKKESDKKESVS